eukprot:CAMPEP_0171987042 /NCGR_PEP_ID=MMETSP0993-20121228/275185_1 /TAXON_ID=483369 /ORGANISM="non described non described, Strain CCMP2098" /LENGTH=449 /DNA_ID=CAMNT_0012639973 /DNA_START=69 /DNA_END=1418 /DNA_ORIENTATION=+
MNSDDLSSCGSWEEKGLWEQIRGYLKPAEEDEIRRAIGETIIERNEDLHREVTALASIVDEFREQSYSFSEERRRKAHQRREASLGLSGGMERKLLEQQIRMLLPQDKQRRGGARPERSVAAAAASRSQSDAKVLEYMASSSSSSSSSSSNGGGAGVTRSLDLNLASSSSSSSSSSNGGGAGVTRSLDLNLDQLKRSGSLPSSARPMSALSLPGSSRQPSARSLPTGRLLDAALDGSGGGGGSGSGGGGAGGGGAASKLNAADISSVVNGLRAAFEEEEVRLREDVEGLMAAFEGEDGQRQEVEAECKASEESVPSTRELREFSQKLQQEELLRAPVASSFSPASPSTSDHSGGDFRRSLPSLKPLGSISNLAAAPLLCGDRNKSDYLRRPPLPMPPTAPPGDESLLSVPSSVPSSRSARLKIEIADAALSARDDYHLNDADDEERFWN